MLLKKYNFEIFADYFAFILQDEDATWNDDLIASSISQIIEELFAVTPGMIHVGTVRDMTVPVTVEIHDSQPNEDFVLWDQVNDCSIEIPSGQIVVLGNDYFPTASRINVSSGTYRAQIFYDSLDTLSENGLDGDDNYTIILWPGEMVKSQVLKSRIKKLRQAKPI